MKMLAITDNNQNKLIYFYYPETTVTGVGDLMFISCSQGNIFAFTA